MFSLSDTIVAIATPPGRGGLGVVRISGAEAHRIARGLTARREPFRPRHATLARVSTQEGAADQVIVTVFASPHSYTGEDVAEISAHGSPVLLRAILAEAARHGARLAAPGEFTLRAYVRGRIDLVQAEAVRDLVESVTPLQARAAFDQLEGTLTSSIKDADAALFDVCARLEASLDFPDEGYHFVAAGGAAAEIDRVARGLEALLADARRGRLIREGAHLVLAGPPNSGKSSLFNRFAGAARAIVTDVPGTTRDLITETIDLDGIPVSLVDTAGLRPLPGDAIEAEGIARAEDARRIAALVLVVLDGSVPPPPAAADLVRELGTRALVVANKSDLPAAWPEDALGSPAARVSALTGQGLDALRAAMAARLGAAGERDLPAITNVRHIALLTAALGSLRRAAGAAGDGAPEEFVLADLNDARAALEQVTGARTADGLLDHIFATFCIGK